MTWPLKPHTAAKHLILRRYLDAWLPKIASRWQRLVFIDGFAGPGEYDGGEAGSPVIAIRAAIEHRSDFSERELVYLFVEADRATSDHLKGVLAGMTIPVFIQWRVVNQAFDGAMDKVMETLGEQDAQMAPALIMVDPFGFSGLPMRVMQDIAKYQRSELLVSFMYESIVRWLGLPQLASTYDDLFGCADWREALTLPDPQSRKGFLLDLYVRQLKAGGMKYARAFEMLDSGNRTEYFLIFATHSKHGLRAMKDSMWKVDPTGAYQFSDATVSNQLTLFAVEPNFTQLKDLLVKRFAGVTATIEEIEDYVLVDTAFREAHVRQNVLVPMEQVDELEVVDSPRRRAKTYPAGTVILFH